MRFYTFPNGYRATVMHTRGTFVITWRTSEPVPTVWGFRRNLTKAQVRSVLADLESRQA